MYASFYEFFLDVFGLDLPVLKVIKMFGFFFAMAFLVAGFVIVRRFKLFEAKGLFKPHAEKLVQGAGPKISELLWNSFFGFVVGFKGVHAWQNFDLFARDPAAILVSTEGHLLAGIVGAIILGGWYYWARMKEKLPEPLIKNVDVWPHQRVGDLIIMAAIFGLIGAKIFTHIEDWENFMRDPVRQFFSFSGLTFYGGLIVAAIALFIYFLKKKMPVFHVMDVVAPALILAYGVGRLGCHFSGDGDWGIVNSAELPSFLSFLPDWLWAYNYPNNVANEGVLLEGCVLDYCRVLPEAVFPTSIYEFLLGLTIFFVLVKIGKYTKIPGQVFGVYLVLNGIERFLIETIRVNAQYDVLGIQLSQAQVIALVLMALGLFMLLMLHLFRDKVIQVSRV